MTELNFALLLTSAVGWSMVLTTMLCWIFHFVPGLRLRASEEGEIVGIDDAYCGEFTNDYIGLEPGLHLHRVDSSEHSSRDFARAPQSQLPVDEKVGGVRVDV
jgi:Amt family ammonium transporter